MRWRKARPYILFDDALATLRLEPHRTLLFNESDLAHVVTHDVRESWLPAVGAVVLVGVTPTRHRRIANPEELIVSQRGVPRVSAHHYAVAVNALKGTSTHSTTNAVLQEDGAAAK